MCSELGLATDDYSFPCVASWARSDMKTATSAADKALQCASVILAALESRRTIP